MEQRKILFVAEGSYVYGAEKINLEIINAAKEADLNIFCTVNGWNDGNYINYLKQRGIAYKEIYLGWYYLTKISWTLDSLRHFPRAFVQYYCLFRKFKPEVTYHYSLRILFLLKPFLKRKNILHVHDRSFAGRQGRWLLRAVDKKVTLYIACSDYIRRLLIDTGVSESKVKVIYNFTDFTPQNEQVSNILPGKKQVNIGIVGQIGPHKGHALLLKALEIVRHVFPDFYLHIIGSGDDRFIQELKDQSRALGLDSRIFWRGYITDKAEIYKDIDFVVIPTLKSEAFGLVAIEPAIFNKPAIVSTVGGLPEIVVNAETGLLFTPGNEKELAEKILFFLQAPSSIDSMGRQANKIYREKFCKEKQLASFIETIINL